MQRREVLVGAVATALGGLGSIGSRAEAAASSAGTCVLTATGDEGPFYFDARLVRSDIVDGRRGVPLQLEIAIASAKSCVPISQARADVWHADADGFYSGYDGQAGTGDVAAPANPGRTFLRGTQFTDSTGAVVFRTIYPSWYRGRTPHIHFKVFVNGGAVVTNQIIFPEDINGEVFKRPPYRDHEGVRDTFNANDGVLKRDGSGVLCVAARHGNGYRARLGVGIA